MYSGYIALNVENRGCTVSDFSVFGSVRFSNFGFGSVRFLDRKLDTVFG